MDISKKIFLDELGRPCTEEDVALIHLYKGDEDKIRFSTYGSLNNINAVLGYAISEHIKHANETLGVDRTADILRSIFEGAKERLGSHGNN